MKMKADLPAGRPGEKIVPAYAPMIPDFWFQIRAREIGWVSRSKRVRS
jgi:hypothetical protein